MAVHVFALASLAILHAARLANGATVEASEHEKPSETCNEPAAGIQKEEWLSTFMEMYNRGEILVHCGNAEDFYEHLVYGDHSGYSEDEPPAVGISTTLITPARHDMYVASDGLSGEPSRRECVVLHAPLTVQRGAIGAGYDLWTPANADRPKDSQNAEGEVWNEILDTKIRSDEKGDEPPARVLDPNAPKAEVAEFLDGVVEATPDPRGEEPGSTYNEIFVVRVPRDALLGVLVHDEGMMQRAKDRLESGVKAEMLDGEVDQQNYQIRRWLFVGVWAPALEIKDWIDPLNSQVHPFGHLPQRPVAQP